MENNENNENSSEKKSTVYKVMASHIKTKYGKPVMENGKPKTFNSNVGLAFPYKKDIGFKVILNDQVSPDRNGHYMFFLYPVDTDKIEDAPWDMAQEINWKKGFGEKAKDVTTKLNDTPLNAITYYEKDGKTKGKKYGSGAFMNERHGVVLDLYKLPLPVKGDEYSEITVVQFDVVLPFRVRDIIEDDDVPF